jgi:hypothetical protein
MSRGTKPRTSHLAFAWHETRPLAPELTAAVTRASLAMMVDKPHLLTLWRADGSGLRIGSRRHDIAERIEIGVLEFDLVRKDDRDTRPSPKGARRLSVVSFDLHPSFGDRLRATKLVISEAGTTAESGLILSTTDGREIVIVSGVYPYSLAVKGIVSMPHGFEPEYHLGLYERVAIA